MIFSENFIFPSVVTYVSFLDPHLDHLVRRVNSSFLTCKLEIFMSTLEGVQQLPLLLSSGAVTPTTGLSCWVPTSVNGFFVNVSAVTFSVYVSHVVGRGMALDEYNDTYIWE